MLALDRNRQPLSQLDESSASLAGSQTNIPNVLPHTPTSAVGPFIFCRDFNLMDTVIKYPHQAQSLLKNQQMYVQCGCCGKTRELEEARFRYLSCKYCYTYYCTRRCRLTDWPSHRDQCNFARINTICKEVILKVKEDPMAQWEMSQVAREGNNARGKGAVNFRFRNPFLASSFVREGWDGLVALMPDTYLYYYTVPNLVEYKKDPSLIALCRRYDPRAKFILSVSIIADVEDCPETPTLRPKSVSQIPTPVETPNNNYWFDDRNSQSGKLEEDSISIPSFSTNTDFSRTQSLPYRHRREEKSREPDARAVLRSVLRSVENIAPGPLPPSLGARFAPPEQTTFVPPESSFARGPGRHTLPHMPRRPPSAATDV